MDIHRKSTVTCSEMAWLEDEGERRGLPKIEMMENAGRKSADFLEHIAGIDCSADAARGADDACGSEAASGSGNAGKLKIGIFCGKGNNGGDGLVMARCLKERGHRVEVYLVEGEPVTDDARSNYDRARDIIALKQSAEARRSGGFDYVVDAVYGTGFHGKLREAGKHAIEAINFFGKQRSTVIALDIPSGIPGDGEIDPENGGIMVPELAVHADHTLCFHAKKPVCDMPEMKHYMGAVHIVDIGIADAIES